MGKTGITANKRSNPRLMMPAQQNKQEQARSKNPTDIVKGGGGESRRRMGRPISREGDVIAAQPPQKRERGWTNQEESPKEGAPQDPQCQTGVTTHCTTTHPTTQPTSQHTMHSTIQMESRGPGECFILLDAWICLSVVGFFVFCCFELVGWPVGWLAGWLVGCLAVCPAGYWVGWLALWLVTWWADEIALTALAWSALLVGVESRKWDNQENEKRVELGNWEFKSLENL